MFMASPHSRTDGLHHGPPSNGEWGESSGFGRPRERSMYARRHGSDGHAGIGDRRLALGAHLGVAKKELAPRRRLAPPFERAAVDERPAVEVVVDVAREDEAVDERRVEEQLLKPLERAEPDQVAAPHADE